MKNEWQFSIVVPEVDELGKKINYNWIEPEIPEYHKGIIETNGLITIITNNIIKIPDVPEDYKQPDKPKKKTKLVEFDEYTTALGINVIINHVGDCFD